jgi:hypothetical protein
MELPLWSLKYILAQAIFKDRVKLTVIKQQTYKKPKSKMNRKDIKQLKENVERK